MPDDCEGRGCGGCGQCEAVWSDGSAEQLRGADGVISSDRCPAWNRINRVVCVVMTSLLSGCIFLPHTTSRYNADCEIYERKMVLESYQIATVAGCSNEGCVAILAAAPFPSGRG